MKPGITEPVIGGLGIPRFFEGTLQSPAQPLELVARGTFYHARGYADMAIGDSYEVEFPVRAWVLTHILSVQENHSADGI